jgi:hypothetical protein
MGRLVIVLLAAIGTVWKIDPAIRPYIDVGMTILCMGLMFWAGDTLNGWLDRWEAKPYWRKVKKAQVEKVRRPRRQRPRHSGASMPLLDRKSRIAL